MDLRQLTVYEQFGWINMRAVTFSFVDQSSSCGLKKFGENIPTSPTSAEVIDVHTLNFKPNVKFSRLIRPPVYGSNGRSYKMLMMFFFNA